MNSNVENSYRVLNLEASNNVEHTRKLLAGMREEECDYLFIKGIFTQNLAVLAEAFEKSPPTDLKAKKVVLIIEDETGEKNRMDVPTVHFTNRIMKTFGNEEKPDKDYYINYRNFGNTIVCSDYKRGFPKDMLDVLQKL